jgi:hypothetical protein
MQLSPMNVKGPIWQFEPIFAVFDITAYSEIADIFSLFFDCD